MYSVEQEQVVDNISDRDITAVRVKDRNSPLNGCCGFEANEGLIVVGHLVHFGPFSQPVAVK